MTEDENIASRGKIDDAIVVNKVLRTLLPIYAIRFLVIQEMRCDPKNDINLDALVGSLITFELDNFDNYVPNSGNIESTFQVKLSLKKKATKSKIKSLIVQMKMVLMIILNSLKH